MKNVNISPFKADFMPLLLLGVGLILGTHAAMGQRNPSIGLSVGASTLSGNMGFMFDSSLDPPHRDFGFSGGLTAFIPLEMDLHLTVGAIGNYERSHFHTDLGNERDIVTGYFHYGYMQFPILLNHAPLHNSKQFFVIKEFFGFGLNVGNYFDAPIDTEFDNPRYAYRTLVTSKWGFNPEFIIGVGLISRQLKFGRIHYSASLHIDVARNQNFQAWLVDRESNQQRFVEYSMRGVKGQFSLTYYPSFHIKKKSCYRFGR